MQLVVVVFRQDHEVFRPVVEFVSIDVMHMLMPFKDATGSLLRHQAVLEHVPVLVGAWMVGSHNVNIAVSNGASALPTWITSTLLYLMAWHIANVVPLAVAAKGLIRFCEWRWLSTSTETQTTSIRWFDLLPARLLGLAEGLSARRMTHSIGLALRRWLSAATAARLSVTHVPTIAHKLGGVTV